VGTSTIGIFALGNAGSKRCKYTYSGDTNASTTASSLQSGCGISAAGNNTAGIFALGACSSTGCGTITRQKFVYSNSTNASAAAASAASCFGAAASNGTCGVNV